MREPMLIPAGRTFTASEIVTYADPGYRSLEDALAEADVFVSGPHATAMAPAEIAPFLAPSFSRRLQYDFCDITTDPIARRWAQLDRRVIYIASPHPRLVGDSNRPMPDDPVATFTEALARARAAGPGVRVDLAGLDWIRPATFAFLPIFAEDADPAAIVEACIAAGAQGRDVYEQARDELLDRWVELHARRGDTRPLTYMSFHDTMNHTATADGAVATLRAPVDRLPDVVALSNRGDADGLQRHDDDPISMSAERLQALAAAHREGFDAHAEGEVALNRPYLGGHELRRAFDGILPRAKAAGVDLSVVQAEFRREYLLADRAGAIMSAGSDWPNPDPAQVLGHAASLRTSWDAYRTGQAG